MNKKISSKLLLVVIIGVMILSITLMIVMVKYASNQAESLLGEQAVQVAETVAEGISVDEFQQVISNPSTETEAFQNIYQFLYGTFLRLSPKYLYTFVEHSETQIMFVVDGSGELNDEMVSMPSDIDDKVNYDEGIHEVIMNHKATFGAVYHSDEYGDMISSYAPIYDEQQQVIGYVGCDISAETYATIRNQLILRGVVSSLLIVGLLVIVFIVLIHRMIAKPIQQITQQAKRVQALDLGEFEHKHLMRRKDEIGALAQSFDSIVASLRSLVQTLTTSSTSLAGASHQLSEKSGQISKISEEIAKTVGELAEGAMTQASDTEHGVENMAMLGEMIQSNANNILSVTHESTEVQNKVKSGIEQIHAVTEMTRKTRQSTEEIFDIIKQTEENSLQINEANTLIASIADQTNLLALNAAIEAARAGESGRGFAVVAEEIRKLAEESRTSAETINQIVQALRTNAGYAVEKMHDVEEVIEEQSDRVNDAEEIYEEISVATMRAGKGMKEIQEHIEEMTEGKNKVMGVLESLAAIAEENAASTEEVSASTEEQTSQLQEIASESESLVSIAQSLEKQVKRFTL